MEIKTYAERYSAITPEMDVALLKRTFEIAQQSRRSGNTPFGALLAAPDGRILMEQTNVELTEHDCTGHAETTLARRAFREYGKEFLWNCSLYTSCEPCCMCTGAIYWANIGRIVFGLSESMLFQTTGDNDVNPTFNSSCREILSKGQKEMVVCGPYPELIEEALQAHKGYWD